MMEVKASNTAFLKGVPSVFAVSSPFQALCAIAAIQQFEIKEYLVVVRLLRGGARNNQIETLLRKYSIPYKCIRLFKSTRFYYPFNVIISYYYKRKALIKHNNRFKRLFIGDFRDTFNCYVGCGLVSDKSDIVYLDDGNITISQLQGRDTEPFETEFLRFLSLNTERRYLVYNKNILTIYDDIPNSNYNICGLRFDLLNSVVQKDKCDIFIVGTNVDRFCGPLNLSKELFIDYIDKLMLWLRSQYPTDSIVYVAHGREQLTYAQELCEKNGCVYCRPETMIEMELLSYPSQPKAIYGFTSTALHTLKKLFPQTRVVNILFDGSDTNPFYIDLVKCSEYYAQNGIEWVKEKL